jgi:neutral ceramidase
LRGFLLNSLSLLNDFCMRFLKIILKTIGGLLVALMGLVAVSVAPVDDTPYQQTAYYQSWKQQLNALPKSATHSSAQTIEAGWAKVNFTPTQPTPTAGYGVRRGKPYISVHDSVYVRALVLDNGITRAAIVVADLLIIPPPVTELLKKKLAKTTIPFENLYLGATHTHNSVGGWGDSVTGWLFAGDYNPKNVENIADAIIKSIEIAQKELLPTRIGYQEIADTAHVYNRLMAGGPTDPQVRTLRLQRQNGTSALLCSYAAHSTILSSDDIVLSRDYPGQLVDSLENGEANFAVFMSGAVGSMGPKEETGANDFDRLRLEADAVEGDVQAMLNDYKTTQTPALQMVTLPLPLREPAPRVSMGWRLRPWAFRWLFGDYPSYIKALRVGDVLLVGVPCDFSGEFMADLSIYAKQKGLHLVVSSFNGGYVGYITPDKYYALDLYETKTMNWFGPQNGAYFQEAIRDLIDKFATDK